MSRTEDAQQYSEKPQPKSASPNTIPGVIPPLAPLPVGTQSLLDGQLGEALKIMRDYAGYVHGPTDIEECIRVGDALGRMMTASATLATVAARLQKGEPETRHRMIVEHTLPGGGGPRKVENE